MTTRPSRVSIVCTAVSTIVLLAMLPGVAASQDEPVTFRVGTTQTATETGLNPFLATAGMDYTLITDVYDLLIEFGPDLEPAAGLAESWEQSEDGLTWTYTIRDGVTWHDGEPLTAEDVAFTFNYIISSQDPAYSGPAAPDGNDLAGAEEEGQPPEPDDSADNPISLYDNALDLDGGFENTRIETVEATDASTVVITTSEPLIVLSQIYIPIVPKHVWETITYAEAANDFTNSEPVGSGPFTLQEYDPDQFWRLEANADYWAGAPKIDELVYQYFENDEASVAALQSGDVDMLVSVPPTLVSTLEGDDNVTVHRAPSSDLAELGFNSWDPDAERFAAEGCADCPKGPTTGSMGDPWLTRAEVRAALAQLVDKQGLVDRALSGFGTPGESLVGPFNEQYHYEPPADDPATYPGTPEAAKERLEGVMSGLGFEDTDGNGILNVPNTADALAFDPEGAGKDWSLRLFVRDDDEEDKVAGELIEAAFEAAGVDVDRQLVKEDPALYDATYPSSTNADMDMYIWGWGPDPDPDFILSVFACAQINNWQDVNYCDPEYDELYLQSRVATDLEARQDIVRRLQAKAYTESPYAVLWYVDTLEAYRSDRWEGFQEHPAGKGSLWSTWGFGPYGSRITVAPVSAAGPSPSASVPQGAASPGESAGASATPTPSAAPGGGSGTGDTALIVGAAAVAVLAALGLFLFARRRSAREEE